VAQVRVVAVLLIIQGVFEGGFGLLLVYQWNKSLVAVVWMGLVFVLAALKIVAGARNFRYRNRTLGIVALAAAPLSLFAVICLPTAILMMVYGLVVYFKRDVEHAFS
jgi:hypothetical protein